MAFFVIVNQEKGFQAVWCQNASQKQIRGSKTTPKRKVERERNQRFRRKEAKRIRRGKSRFPE